MAQIIGIDQLEKHLKTFKHISKIEVREKEKSRHCIFFASTAENGEVEKPLKEFFEMQKENPTSDFASFYITVYLKGPTSGQPHGKDYVGFTFTLNNRTYNAANITGNQSNGVNQSVLDLHIEIGYLRSENKKHLELIDELEDEIEELETKNEENAGKVGGSNGLVEGFKELDKIFGIKELLSGLRMGSPAPLVANTETANIIAELQMMDENFDVVIKDYYNRFVKAKAQNEAGN